jgi:hypothetical protein
MKEFAIRIFYCSGGSRVALERRYLRVCSFATSGDAMYRTAEQLAETGSVRRKRAKGHKHGASVLAEEVVGAPGDAVIRSERQSVRYLERQSGVSNSSACKNVAMTCFSAKCS